MEKMLSNYRMKHTEFVSLLRNMVRPGGNMVESDSLLGSEGIQSEESEVLMSELEKIFDDLFGPLD